MKKKMLITAFLAVILLVLSGCTCKHTWKDADCFNPKICLKCQETEGAPLDHTPGQWIETFDVAACTISREQHCMNCNQLLDSEQAPITTMIQDELFLFSPNEFLKRLTSIAKQYDYTFTYECTDTSVGLQVFVQNGEKESIIQFFNREATTLDISEMDSPVVWCASLSSIGQADADFVHYFMMACDPKLDKDAAFDVYMALLTAYLNASITGEILGYHQENGLLYEFIYYPEEVFGQEFSLIDIYASDFR